MNSKHAFLALSVFTLVSIAHGEREVFAPTKLAPVVDAGTIRLDNGTAGVPSLSFKSDTDTGLYRNGANNLSLTTNAVGKFHVTSNTTPTVVIGDEPTISSVPLSGVLRATSGNGTNIAGGALTIQGGFGTGSGAGGDISFQTAPAGSSGSSNNTLIERLRINQFGGVTIGNGIDNAAPNNGIIRATNGLGTNIAGGSFSIRGGQSTGNAAGGAVIVETAPAGASGAGANSVTERMRITSAGVMLMASGSSIDAGGARFELPNGTALPATCLQGELFHDTDSNDCINTAGGDGALCICKTTNTWALISNF